MRDRGRRPLSAEERAAHVETLQQLGRLITIPKAIPVWFVLLSA